MLAPDTLEHLDDVARPVAEPRLDRRRDAREGIHDRQRADLPSRRQMVVHEVHRPGLVGPLRRSSVIAQRRLYPPLRHLVAQLQAEFPVDPVRPLMVQAPSLPPQQHMHAPIAVAHARRADLPDAPLKAGLVGST